MSELKNKLKIFYNDCDVYARNLETLDINWYKKPLELFSQYMPEGNGRILDLGCGIGTTTRWLGRKFERVIGLDYSLEFCKYSKGRTTITNSVSYINSDACFLPLRDECLNGIFSFTTIEHLYDVEKALDELDRVLRKEGIILIHMPNLLTPLRPIKAIFSREKLKYPKPESGENVLHSLYLVFRDLFLILRKYATRNVNFIYRNPDLEVVEGDYDAVYLASPIDIKKCFRRRNYEVKDLTYVYKPYKGKSRIKKMLKWALYKMGILQMIRMPRGTYSTLVLRKL
jgi:SAM-dependent methyltransferase